LLIILSDVDGLYDSDPRNNSEAHRMSYVKKLSSEHLKAAGGRGSRFSSGGMETKLKAVAIAGDAGCPVILAHGRSKQVLRRICGGEDIGTFFAAAQPLKNRQRWIKNADPQGSITVDAGALAAIMKKGSLLPSGVTGIHGVFTRGAVILVNNQIKLISSFDSNELEKILGRHSAEIRKILGKEGPEVIARPEDMVIL
ncbi:MAG: PUA domain-containing protein, partial [Salinispira sp.]